MIDIHSHILPGVDDGAKNIQVSMKIAEETVRQGIEAIVATPHFMEEGYRMSPSELKERVKRLQREIDEKGLGLQVYPGAEVFIYPSLAKDLERGLVPTINDSRYILLEFPMERFPAYTEELLYNLKLMGFEIVICHPERYLDIMKDPNILYNWAEEGIYGQLNTGSILGVFGERVEKTAEILIRHNTVQLLGSDVHSLNRRRQNFREGMERIALIKEGMLDLFIENNRRIIKDEKLLRKRPCFYEKRKGLLGMVRQYLSG